MNEDEYRDIAVDQAQLLADKHDDGDRYMAEQVNWLVVGVLAVAAWVAAIALFVWLA